jgi:hypothetical protein
LAGNPWHVNDRFLHSSFLWFLCCIAAWNRLYSITQKQT